MATLQETLYGKKNFDAQILNDIVIKFMSDNNIEKKHDEISKELIDNYIETLVTKVLKPEDEGTKRERKRGAPVSFAETQVKPPTKSKAKAKASEEKQDQGSKEGLSRYLNTIQQEVENKLKSIRTNMKTVFDTKNILIPMYIFELYLDYLSNNDFYYKVSYYNFNKAMGRHPYLPCGPNVKEPCSSLNNEIELFNNEMKPPIIVYLNRVKYPFNTFKEYLSALMKYIINERVTENVINTILESFDNLPSFKQCAINGHLRYSPVIEDAEQRSECTICYLCGRRLFYNRNGKETNTDIDHIVPYISGYITGVIHFPSNYLPTHAKCNGPKSDNLPNIYSIDATLQAKLADMQANIPYDKLRDDISEKIIKSIFKSLPEQFNNPDKVKDILSYAVTLVDDNVFKKQKISRGGNKDLDKMEKDVYSKKSSDMSIEYHHPITPEKSSKLKKKHLSSSKISYTSELNHTIQMLNRKLQLKNIITVNDNIEVKILIELINYLTICLDIMHTPRHIHSGGGLTYTQFFNKYGNEDLAPAHFGSDEEIQLMSIDDRVKFFKARIELYVNFSFLLARSYR